MALTQIITLVIFVLAYLGIIFNGLPKMNIDRKTSAYIGCVLMIVFGSISFEDAIKSIDFNTIALLLGMMIIISALKLQGVFEFISNKAISSAQNTSKLLTLIVFVTGIASAFLVNDAVVLLFTPVIINICKKFSLNPIPFLLGEIFSSNAGSLMAITGNPQNMIIGITSGISYAKFMFYMLPIAVVSMIIIIFVIKHTNKEFLSLNGAKSIIKTTAAREEKTAEYDIKSALPTLVIFLLVVVGFFIGKILNLSIPLIAVVGSALVLMVSKQKAKDVFEGVDWSLLLFFASLFIIVAAVKQSGVLASVFELSLKDNMLGVAIIFALSLVLSQVLSNVPYTILVLPIMTLANSQLLWLALAASSTLAGNLTIVGAMANLIVIEQAEKEGVKISSRAFYKPAITITILTFAFALVMFAIY